MAEAQASKIIDAPADWAWRTVRAFSGLETYFTMFAGSTTEGSGVGATRTLELPDGGRFLERLESLDDDARKLIYVALESPLPISDYVGTVTVEDAADNRARVTWGATFEVSPDRKADMVTILSGAYASGIDGLQALYRK